MRPEERDAAYLWDMLESARTVSSFMAGVSAEAYARDRKLQLAVERAIEIIGEAARRLSTAFKEAHPEIPWRAIIAQRNVIAHEYGDIKQERLWAVATRRVSELLEQLVPLVQESPPED